MRTNYEVYYYYTWQDFLTAFINDGNPVNPFDNSRMNLIKLPLMAATVGLSDTDIKPIMINGTEDDTFYKLLYGKYYSSAIIKTTNDYSESGLDYNPEVKDWVARMVVKMLETQDKYIALLDFYAKEKEKLLAPISTSLKVNTEGNSDSRSTHDNDVNNYDLPSNAYPSQSPSGCDAEFVSQMQELIGEEQQHSNDKSFTNQISEDDRESKIKRLNELDTMYKNTLKDWVGEFSRLFYEEINY